MLKLNRGDQAKQCFMEALALDVKCYDAFEQLVSGEMMAPDEGNISPPLLIMMPVRYSIRMGIRPVPLRLHRMPRSSSSFTLPVSANTSTPQNMRLLDV